MKRYKRDFDEPEEQELDIAEFASLDEYKRIVEKHKERVEEKRSAIDNREQLLLKLDEIELPREWPWIEKLEVDSLEPVDVEDPEDDLKREATFYASALAATKQALNSLKQLKIPFQRPLDFYAETVKPDSHMAKVKQVLLNEQRKTAEVEERKKQQAIRKFSKVAKSEAQKKKSKEKREALDAIDELKNKSKYKHNEPSSRAFKKAIRKTSFKRVQLDEGTKRVGGSSSSKKDNKRK